MSSPASTSRSTARRGVNAVERLVLRDLGWIFREQQVDDYGIDAIVEVVDHDGLPTGRLLALQIKAGPHTQRAERAGGWNYPVKAKHERYWRNHALPVILVLVNIDEERAWWQHVTPATLRPTPKNFAVLVPASQPVAEAAERWRHLASDRYAHALVRYPAVLEELPPATGQWLQALAEEHTDDAAVLAAHLAEAPGSSGGAGAAVSALLQAPPPYLDSALGWRALGVFAAEHGLRLDSATALQNAAAQDTPARARLLASAAAQLHTVDNARAEQLADQALVLDPGEPRALVARVALAHGDRPGPITVPRGVDLTTQRALNDPTVQTLLAEIARRQDDPHLDVEHHQRAHHLAPHDASHQVGLAAALMRRSQGRQAQLSDLPRAVALLEDAVTQLHRWNGPTHEALEHLVSALGLALDWAGVLRWAQPAPAGRATQAEAERPRMARLAFEAAQNLGQHELARQLAERLSPTGPEGLSRAAALGQPVPQEEAVRIWRQAAEDAAAHGDDRALVLATFHLADHGVDASDKLAAAVASGAVPQRVRDLVAVVAAAAVNLEAALPALRQLADDDPTAAERLVVALGEAGRTDEAVAAAMRAQERLRQPSLGLLSLDVLISARRGEEAARVAAEALASGEHTGLVAARLHHLLGSQAADQGEWGRAERHFSRAVQSVDPPRPERVWNLVLTQLRQHEPRRAAATLRSHPVDIIDAPAARMWLEAHLGEQWDADLVSTALVLAERYQDDEVLVDELLRQVVLATQAGAEPGRSDDRARVSAGPEGDVQGVREGEADQGVGHHDDRPVVPAELHRRAFEMVQRRLEQRQSRFTSLSGTPEELLDQLRDLAQHRHESLRGVDEDAVRSARLPLGLVATAAGWSPAMATVARVAGMHVAVPEVDAEHEAEVEAADRALGGAVVVDASSLHLAQQVPGPSRLAGQFTELRTSDAVRQDILRAVEDARRTRAHAGTLVWDEARGSVVVHRDDPARVEQVIAQCEALVRAAEATTSIPVAELTVLELGEELDNSGEARSAQDDSLPQRRHRRQQDAVDGPWLSAVQLAFNERRSLWSDDLVLRRLAREVGLNAFGTVALLEAICRRTVAAIPEDEHAGSRIQGALDDFRDQIRALASVGVVDLPLHRADLLVLAEADNWQLGAATVALMRSSMWRLPGEALLSLDALLQQVAMKRPDGLRAWVRSAMTGAATGLTYEAEGRSLVLAVIAELGGEPMREVGSAVAHERGLPDPVRMVARAQRLVNILRTGRPEG